MKPTEFQDALMDASHTMAIATVRPEAPEEVIAITLLLSNGRRIVIEPATTSYGDPDLFLNIEEEST